MKKLVALFVIFSSFNVANAQLGEQVKLDSRVIEICKYVVNNGKFVTSRQFDFYEQNLIVGNWKYKLTYYGSKKVDPSGSFKIDVEYLPEPGSLLILNPDYFIDKNLDGIPDYNNFYDETCLLVRQRRFIGHLNKITNFLEEGDFWSLLE